MFESESQSSSQERSMSQQEQQELLSSSAVWIQRIIATNHDPDDIDSITFARATPEAVAEKNESGSLTIYDLIGEYLVEYSTYNTDNERTGITHYVLNQKQGGIWNLETTDDLFNSIEIIFGEIEYRGHELSDHDERLSLKEPLYPELLKPATSDDVATFNNLIEIAGFGGTTLFFSKLEHFMHDVARIQDDIATLSDDTSEE